MCSIGFLGGGFKYFLFSPLFGEDEPILTHIFQMGWNHQPDHHCLIYSPKDGFLLFPLIFFRKKLEGFMVCPDVSQGFEANRWVSFWHVRLLMEEILHQLMDSLSHFLRWFIYMPDGAGFLNHQHYEHVFSQKGNQRWSCHYVCDVDSLDSKNWNVCHFWIAMLNGCIVCFRWWFSHSQQ